MATFRPACVVGIAGGSASGKTTLTRAVVDALITDPPGLVVEVFPMDRYFYRGAPGGPTLTSPSTGEQMPDNNHPNSADNDRLIADLDSRLGASDSPDVVIVEGLMALHVDAVRERLTLKLFVELDADLRALRRLLRDMSGERGSRDPEVIAAYYRECARVGHDKYVEPSRCHADLIVRGDAHPGALAGMIAAIVSQPSVWPRKAALTP